MFFRAKKDGWVNFVAGLAGVAMVIVGAWLVWSGMDVGLLSSGADAESPEMVILTIKTTPFLLLSGALLPVFGALLIWCLAATCYEISFEHLIVQSGPSLRRIPLKSILAARVTHGGVPRGPVWSREMVRIEHRRGRGERRASIAISPQDPAAFLQSLARVAPALKQRDDGSLRAGA